MGLEWPITSQTLYLLRHTTPQFPTKYSMMSVTNYLYLSAVLTILTPVKPGLEALNVSVAFTYISIISEVLSNRPSKSYAWKTKKQKHYHFFPITQSIKQIYGNVFNLTEYPKLMKINKHPLTTSYKHVLNFVKLV